MHRITVITWTCSHTNHSILCLPRWCLSHPTHFAIVQTISEFFEEIGWAPLLLLLSVIINLVFTYYFGDTIIIIIRGCTYSDYIRIRMWLLIIGLLSSACSSCGSPTIFHHGIAAINRHPPLLLRIRIDGKCGCVSIQLILLLLCHVACEAKHEVLLCMIYISIDMIGNIFYFG